MTTGRLGDLPSAQVEFFEKNGARDSLCSVSIDSTAVTEYRKSAFERLGCSNDEARSLKLYNVPAGAVVEVYDDGQCRANDDWARITVKRPLESIALQSFESSFSNGKLSVDYRYGGNLDGKVSCVRVSK